MSAPQVEAQSKIRGAFQQILELKEGWEMSMKKGMKQAAAWIHDGLATITTGKMLRGLAMGILLMAATGMYFGMTSGSASEATTTPPSYEVDSEFRFTDLDSVDDLLSVEDLLTYVYPEEAGQVKAGSPPSSKNIDSEFRFTDIDNVDDRLSVEDLLTYVYPEEAGQVRAGSRPSRKSIDSEFRFTDLDRIDDRLSVEDLLTYVYPEEAGQGK